MAGIKKETMTDHEAQSDTGEEYIEKVCKADVAPKLTCMRCKGFYRGSVKFCINNHGFCSSCSRGIKEWCPVAGCRQNAIVTVDVLSELVKELKLPLPCKFKNDGCNKENADEEVIADHEIECGFKKVVCQQCCSVQPAMELEAHIFSAHADAYGKHRDNPGKWFLNKSGGAEKMWIDSESGLRFWAALYHDDGKKLWKCSTRVFGRENVAKKFRAELRFSSHDVDTSVIFNGNVYYLDE